MDLRGAIRPMFFPSVLMFLAVPDESTKMSTVSRIHRVLSWIVFGLFLSLTVTYLPEYFHRLLSSRTSSKSPPIREYISTIWWVLVSLLGCSGSLLLYFRRSRIAGVVEDMAILDHLYRRLFLNTNKRTRSSIMLQTLCLAATFILAVGLHFYVANANLKTFHGILNAAGIYWLMITLVVDFQISNLFLILSRNLKALNLKAYRIFRRPRSQMFVAENTWEKKRHSGSKESKTVSLVAVFCLKQHRIATEINSIYGVFFLLQVPSNLAQVMFHLYYYAEMVLGLSHSENLVYNVTEVYVWSISYLLGLSSVVAACNMVIEQEKRMHYLVADMLNQTRDNEVQRKLQELSRQLHLTPVKFKACGFFEMDHSLLVSMAAAILSQLVMLIQFKQSSITQN